MSKRTLRRSATRAVRKATRQAQLSQPAEATDPTPAEAVQKEATDIPNIVMHQGRPVIERPCSYDPTYIFRDEPNAAELAAFRHANPDSPLGQPKTSEAKIIANRENAKKSTGPVSNEGKAISSLNAVKYGLTGNTILLAADDAEAYEKQLNDAAEEFKPTTPEERRLVQSMHDCAWRLDRILRLESTLFAKGRIELQYQFEELPGDQRKNHVEAETMERNNKTLKNLYIQEARLNRQRKSDIAALKKMREERVIAESAEEKPAAVKAGIEARHKKIAEPKVGFVLETPQTTATQPELATDPPQDKAA